MDVAEEFRNLHEEKQGRGYHVDPIIPDNTLKSKKISSLLPYFRGSMVLYALEHITDHIKCILSQAS